MTIEYASSIQAVALRICRLGADGAPLVGVKNAFVTSQFTQVGWTPQYDQGDEINQKAADGTQCVYFKMDDTLKNVQLSLAICNPQPEITEMIAGGSLLMQTTNVVGWAAPESNEVPVPNGVGIEVWSRAIVGGRPAAVNPYWRWVFPLAKMRADGERVLENGLMANAFTGESIGNDAFGDGPQGDWTLPTLSAVQYARDATAPTGVNDYQAVIADV